MIFARLALTVSELWSNGADSNGEKVMRGVLMVSVMALIAGSAAADDLSNLRKQMADQMREPTSAVFRKMSIGVSKVPGVGVACGEVNGKNGNGGYTGFKPFMAMYNLKSKSIMNNPFYVPEADMPDLCPSLR